MLPLVSCSLQVFHVICVKRTTQESTKLNIPAFPLIIYLVSLYSFLALSRFALHLFFWERLSLTGLDQWMMYLVGLRMDSIIICYSLALILLPYVFLPLQKKSFWKFTACIHFLLTTLFFFMELTSPPYFNEYDMRPDHVFFEYLGHPREVVSMIVKTYPWFTLFGILFFILFCRYNWKATFALWSRHQKTYQHRWWKRILVFVIGASLVVIGGRSSFGHRPANISSANFSSNRLINELALNSTYTVAYSIYRLRHEVNASDLYPTLPNAEVNALIKRDLPEKLFLFPEDDFRSHSVSKQKKLDPLAPTPNIVIVLMESVGAEFTGFLGGTDLTPELDRWSKQGLLFKKLYATGTRTVRGLEATLTGFLPTPGVSVVKLNGAKKNFFTYGEVAKQAGMDSLFIYGGESHFDEMKSFFLGNGVNRIIDQNDFPEDTYKGSWGVHDDSVMEMAHKTFKESYAQKKPFFGVVLTTSNHTPFDFPDGRVDYNKYPKDSHESAIRFTDYAVGRLLDLASKEDYFKNTYFLILADHNTRIYGDQFVPLHKFWIPAILIGPEIEHGSVYNKLASQIDLLPSLINFLPKKIITPMIGRNLFDPNENARPGRAIMQYAQHMAYWEEGKGVAILRPKIPIEVFSDGAKLIPFTGSADSAEELKKKALAYILWPQLQYAEKYYTPEP
jgi:phosphoglycerol transferase MdoB-like AlkP superfamily enzyme